MKKKILALTAAALMLAAMPAAAADLWFHVTVVASDGDNANVTVNLPISMVEKALTMIPEEEMKDGRIVIDDAEFDAAKLRELWQEVKSTPDMNFVTVRTDDETVQVYKQGGYLVAHTTESTEDGAKVDARIPLSVVDALLSTDDNTLDLRAALEALVAHGGGELVTVSERDNQVRVWIDDIPEAR